MTRNCVKLKNFRLEINDNSLISDNFFAVLSHLKSIEILEIVLGLTKKLRASVKSLKDCPKLKRLLITYNELTEDFFAGIHSYVPNIKTIEIKTKQRMSDQFFTSLSSMRYLQKIIVEFYNDFKEIYYNKNLKANENNNRINYLNSNCGVVDLSNDDDDDDIDDYVDIYPGDVWYDDDDDYDDYY